MIRFLAEDASYKVYALYESVYLKLKGSSRNQNDYEKQDLLICCHYGDPSAAIILPGYIIVAGCGLTIFDLEKQEEATFFNEPDSISWTNGLYQDGMDSPLEFRYVTLTDDEKLRVFKMNALTKEVTQLD
jgi:hypothetical protein